MTDVAQEVAPIEPGSAAEGRGAGRAGSKQRFAWGALGLCVLSASIVAAPGVEGALGGALGIVALRIAYIDARRFLVPDVLSGAAFALGLAHAAIASPEGVFDEVVAAATRGVVAAGLFLAIRVAYQLLRGREGMGLGDVKLAAAAGAWLSFSMLAVAIELAAVAALGAYLWRQANRARTLRAADRLPFGAFFALAIWVGWIGETMLDRLS